VTNWILKAGRLLRPKLLSGVAGKSGSSAKFSIVDTLRLCDATGAVLKTLDLKRKAVGKIYLPSGRISASDPQTLFQAEAVFSIKVEPGPYPVNVYLLTAGEAKQIAFAEIRFRDEPVSFWTLASRYGKEITIPNEEGGIGYGVDTGQGCFMSPEAYKLLTAAINKAEHKFKDGFDYFGDVVKVPASQPTAFMHQPNKDFEANMVIFDSGEGDGSYCSYYGLNANGLLLNLVTVFIEIEGRA
jgi:hypothetical protein